ncbi:MAG: L-serine ammonia-lyase, partial [Gammaproteobacteria bacterium]|nr:L-serine ammonia-lyase [Gammaproteobacteria bacterium]
MFISVLELFKVGVGPSSSHTMGPMVAAIDFLAKARKYLDTGVHSQGNSVQCVLKGALAFTGPGHGTDRAVALGLHGYTPSS